MLDEKDLQAIQAMIDASEERIAKNTKEEILEAESRIAKNTKEEILEAESRITKNTVVMMEAEFSSKFNLLAEGIQDIQEKLVPRTRVDNLEDEVKFLKVIVRQMAERISELEKAN